MSPTVLIGGDWGGSNLRLFRFGPCGEILAGREAPIGALSLRPETFGPALAAELAEWSPEGVGRGAPVVLCGMVGARSGWREAGYVRCPAGLDDVVGGASPPTSEAPAWIVPGLVAGPPGAPRDVIRGEETQVLGADPPDGCDLVLAPGTHSKWITVVDGRVLDHFTFITGELFALLRRHSSLCRLAVGDTHDDDAYAAGVARALDAKEGFGSLFLVRVDSLFGGLRPETVATFLSGFLIGLEVREGLHRLGGPRGVHLVASPQLAVCYRVALAMAGVGRVTVEDGVAASAHGLWRIGTRLCGLETS